MRIVYDASARCNGPSLNDCLHAGPAFGQNVLDIILRFRLYATALTRDIEKAFLMVSIATKDRDSLRFLWIDNIASSLPKIVILRFTRVVFGITSSPFLLNATLQLHLKKYEMEDPSFVNKFMHSIYVDDVAFGGDSTNEVFELYLKTKSRLAEGGFNLRKFVSNDRGLQEKIERQEGLREMFTQGCTVAQDDN